MQNDVVCVLLQSTLPTSDSDDAVAKKNQKETDTGAHSSDLFSVHNFDVTIDLNFPAGQCYNSVLTVLVAVCRDIAVHDVLGSQHKCLPLLLPISLLVH